MLRAWPTPGFVGRSRESHEWRAAAMLSEHELLSEVYWAVGTGARWLIGRPTTGVYRCEIIAGTLGSLLVYGDFPPARFAKYGDNADAWDRLCWLADSTDVGYYVMQKASIGMGIPAGYDAEVARHDLRALADDHRRDGDEQDAPGLIPLLEEAAERYAEREQELRAFLHAGDRGWGLWELTIGRVVPEHVVIAHVALNRCAWLLRERHGLGGPACCRRAGEP